MSSLARALYRVFSREPWCWLVSALQGSPHARGKVDPLCDNKRRGDVRFGSKAGGDEGLCLLSAISRHPTAKASAQRSLPVGSIIMHPSGTPPRQAK